MYSTSQTYNVANDRAYYWGNPIGTLISFYGNTAPAHYWQCAGQWYDRNVYTALFNVIQSDYLPDFRECAIVGIGQNYRDSNSGLAVHDVYTLGQFKDDQFQTHWHGADYGEAGAGNHRGFAHITLNEYDWTPAYSPSGRNGDVTRGKRMGALICIRYE